MIVNFFINILTFFMTKVFPIFALVAAYIHALVTFSRFPILEFIAKKKLKKILKNHFPKVSLSSIRRTTDSGIIKSYYEFDIVLKKDDEYYTFYQMDYKDFTAENLNPTPNAKMIKEKLNTLLKKLNNSLQYEIIYIEQSFNFTSNDYIKNAFNVTIVDKNINELMNMRSLYMHQIKPQYIKEWLKSELFEQWFRDSFKKKFGSFDTKLMDLKIKIDKIFKEEFPFSPYKLIVLEHESNSLEGDIRLFFQDTRDKKNKIIKEKVINSNNINKDSFESWFKDGTY
ncbi:hypothetical protein CRU99_02815 [Malaciobacter mytili]|uniref:hypothetical protein n=1 Tax=Malaciobacter mytili TaxID=603050 RepID=UPI00100AB1B4|nr:hypothetical protein [Malaciobacter mytili]RXI47107.1 hypothetical protein CRU99_02815 [Malaciobacter mytili]